MTESFGSHLPYARWAHVLLRVIASLIIMSHGAQKFFGIFGGTEAELGSMMWIASVIELFGGIFVLVGLFTRPMALLLSGLMASAYFIAHFPQHFMPVVNGGELAILLCFTFLYFAATGAGTASFDYIRSRKVNNTTAKATA